jgi:hypothetical protein
MAFAKARFRLVGDRGGVEGVAIVGSGAWYTIIDEKLAEYLGVKYRLIGNVNIVFWA